MTSAERNTGMWRVTALLTAALWVLPAWAGPEIQSWQTPNGTRVLFVAAPELPMLDVRVVFNAGSARDGGQPGVASLTNAMLTEGAGKWNADQIAERLEGVGSTLETGSLRDMAWASARTLTRQPALDTTLETLAAVLGDPTFPEPDLERLRKSTLVALRQDEQSPSKVGQKALYRAVFGDHPYASDPTGTRASVERMTRADLLAYYHRYYVARNAVVAMVGDLSREQAKHIAEQVTAGLAPGEPAPSLGPAPALASASLERIDFPSSQSHLYIGQPGVQRGDPDYFPLYVGNHILGGNGLVSLLSEEVREKRGLSYSVYSYFLPMQVPGPFLLGLQTRNDQADEARSVLMQTLRRFIEQGPTEAELTAAKKNITGGFPLRISSNGKIAEYLSMIGFYDLPLDYLDTFNARVEAVTGEQIRDAFHRRVHPERLATVVVGPARGAQVVDNRRGGPKTP